jgi:hypothetical protein
MGFEGIIKNVLEKQVGVSAGKEWRMLMEEKQSEAK